MTRKSISEFLSSPIATILLVMLSGVIRLVKGDGFSWIYTASVSLLFVAAVVGLIAIVVRVRSSA